jgi:H-type small acid-soluble spore protein
LNRQRVKQILESHGVIGIAYQDAPVWIEQLNQDDTAQVTLLGTNERVEVPVSDLIEADPV